MDHVPEGERHESTHRKRDRRCVTRPKRRPDDRERATGRATCSHCGRPPSDRRAGVGEIANRRMVKRRHPRNGRYIEVTGSMNGETSKMAVDSQTGRLRADNDDDDDDDDD